ncbi:hypothetical protein BH10ACT3_BH10ACT3_23490 [soil metagenome]
MIVLSARKRKVGWMDWILTLRGDTFGWDYNGGEYEIVATDGQGREQSVRFIPGHEVAIMLDRLNAELLELSDDAFIKKYRLGKLRSKRD